MFSDIDYIMDTSFLFCCWFCGEWSWSKQRKPPIFRLETGNLCQLKRESKSPWVCFMYRRKMKYTKRYCHSLTNLKWHLLMMVLYTFVRLYKHIPIFLFQYGDTLLHSAVRGNHLHLVQFLLERPEIHPNEDNWVRNIVLNITVTLCVNYFSQCHHFVAYTFFFTHLRKILKDLSNRKYFICTCSP